ncbi:MAG: M14 family zinc carboxypeptidase, partial [Cyclobacteriaceae bacterium]
MKKLYTFTFLFSIFFHLNAQTKSPAEFLGYELGERFTPHHRMVAYFQHVAASNSHVKIQEYGKTNERRPLMVAFISSQENIDQLETIRTDNLKRAGILSGETQTRVPITWMSYNVHGNEAVSSEATMMTLFSLVYPGETKTKGWLENSLVVLDPCLNPDGHDRYVNWYNQKMNDILQPDPQSVEHIEPWPGGRANHYLFDLNRDWAWQTQIESRQRMALYNHWLPQVHLDFHEQGVDEPYYFAPAAEPLHHQLTPFQMEYQEIFGRNTAGYFDQNDWFYFTKERFDLLYPSYGDTYPMYNGAIGMTIEQGGSGRAGIGIINAEGDTLTLKERIVHHHTTGLSAIETTSEI